MQKLHKKKVKMLLNPLKGHLTKTFIKEKLVYAEGM
jgi:hypothetical protein